MTIYYRINSGEDGAVLTVFGDVNESITSETKTYAEAVQYLTTTDPEDLDAEHVANLMSPKLAVSSYLRKVSDRVSFRGNALLFDGDVVSNSLSDAIIRLSTEDESGDPTKLVRFLENLMTNPSEHSREQLYDWIAPRNITITSDGHFLAYKGLRSDFTSINRGKGTVNNVEYSSAYLDNTPGNVVEFPRSEVVANSHIGCAVGLHAGTYEYANDFAQGRLVLVKINPRDVVSVPTDSDAQKLRVSRYEVLEEIQGKIEDVYYDSAEDEAEDQDAYYDSDEYHVEDVHYDLDVYGDDEESNDQYSRLHEFLKF